MSSWGSRALAMAALVALVGAADAVRTERVEFVEGESSASVEGDVAGFGSVRYTIEAGAGQDMQLRLEADNLSTYFNVYRPGDVPGQSMALHVGPRDGNEWQAGLRASGDYTVEIFLIRAAARRNETAQYRLDVAITGEPAGVAAPAPDFADGLAGGPDYWQVTAPGEGAEVILHLGPSGRARVVGRLAGDAVLRNLGCEMQGEERWCQVEEAAAPHRRGWVAGASLREASPEARQAAIEADPSSRGTADAGGAIACSLGPGQPAQQCAFRLQRRGGDATMTVTRPDGTPRVIYFQAGRATGTGIGGGDFGAVHSGDMARVTIGDEAYEIPDAAVSGD